MANTSVVCHGESHFQPFENPRCESRSSGLGINTSIQVLLNLFVAESVQSCAELVAFDHEFPLGWLWKDVIGSSVPYREDVNFLPKPRTDRTITGRQLNRHRAQPPPKPEQPNRWTAKASSRKSTNIHL